MLNLNPRLVVVFSLTLNVVVVIFACLYDGPSLLPTPGARLSSYDISPVFRLDSWKLGQNRESKAVTGVRDCSACAIAPRLCGEYGEIGLARAFSYFGGGERFRRFLLKARELKGFSVAVIGGSVSAGHGLGGGAQERYKADNMHRAIFDHLNELFPAPYGESIGWSNETDEKNHFYNGALPATGTDVFAVCYHDSLPENVDLVLSELAVNDDLYMFNMDSYERMARGILDLPHQPAMLNLQSMALEFGHIAMGGDLHIPVAQYYDLPIIAIRNIVFPSLLNDRERLTKEWFVHRADTGDVELDYDLRHISKKGHHLMANLSNAYIDMQLCELDKDEARHGKLTPEDINVPSLPSLRMYEPYDPEFVTPKLEPQCFMADSERHPLVPFYNDGWEHWSWRDKHYIVTNRTGAEIKFKLDISHIGVVEISYQKSRDYGLGSVICWLDDDRLHGTKVDGWWNNEHSMALIHTIAQNVEPGQHDFTCELLETTADPGGGKEFRLISLTRWAHVST